MVAFSLARFSVLSLTLAATLSASTLFELSQTPPGGGNPDAPQLGPRPQVVKEVMAAEPDGRALCLAISPGGGTLAAGCTDRLVYLLGPLSGEKRRTLASAERGYIRGVAFVPGGKTIAVVSDDNQLRLWDTTSGKLLKALPALGDSEQAGLPPLGPACLAVSPDGGLIAMGGAGTADGSGHIRLDENTFFELRVRNTKTGEITWSHVGRRGFMSQLAFSPGGTTLAGATLGEVRLWDARTGNPKRNLKPASGSVWGIAFSPDNRLLAGCGSSTMEGKRRICLTLWDAQSGAIIHSIDTGEAGGAVAPGTLAFSPDGKSLASAATGIKTGRISINGGNAFNGQKVVNNVKLWDVKTGRLVWTSVEGDYGQIESLVFSREGLSVYCCDSSAVSRIDARTGQTRKDLMRATDDRPR